MSDPRPDPFPARARRPAGHSVASASGTADVVEPVVPAESATFLRATEYIGHNLSRRDLNPTVVAQAIGVSRAVLYREFTASGGVSKYIQDIRIAGARAHLQMNGDRRLVVSETSDRFGYASVARFARLFRQRYHETPAAFVERVRAITLRPR